MVTESDITTTDITLTEANYQLFEDLAEILDNQIFHINENDRELIKEMMAYLLAKDYVVTYGPDDVSGLH